MNFERQRVNLDDIDAGTVRTREHATERSQEVISEYRDAYARGDDFPPIVVCAVEDHGLVLVDGWHRYYAMAAVENDPGCREPVAFVSELCSIEDAWRYALEQTNQAHGLRLSNEDKRERIRLALSGNLYPDEISNRELAERLGCVSYELVRKVRSGLADNIVSDDAEGQEQPEDYAPGGAEEPDEGQAESETAHDPHTNAPGGDFPGEGPTDGEAEPPPPSGGADERPEWLPERKDFEDAASLLKSASRKLANRENASGEEGQVAATICREAKQLATKAAAMVPVVCPRCGGKGCRPCGKAGWLRWGAAQQLETSGRKRGAA